MSEIISYRVVLRVEEYDILRLKRMKGQMAKRGNWKEVERINKMIRFQEERVAEE